MPIMLQRIKKQLRNLLSGRTFRSWRNLYVKVVSRLQCNNLRRLAELHGTDEFFAHNYIDVYEKHFHKFRKQPITFLEIGVGGYDDPQTGRESLRMWKNYFVNGRIHTIDIFEKALHQQDRIRIYKESPANLDFL